jgi:penicillin amidase
MVKKIVIGAIATFLIILISVGIFVCIQIKQLKPDYSGEFSFSELNQKVTIAWDSSGVIHIQGNDVYDVIFASGFVTAKSRLWQMTLLRRMGQGRLSEIFGNRALHTDKLFRTLGLDSLSKKLYSELSTESKEWVDAYAAGINAYLEKTGDDLPLEFILMNFKPKKWQPSDCLISSRIMAWLLNFSWRGDLFYWELQSKVPKENFREMLPDWRGFPTILHSDEITAISQNLTRISREMESILGMELSSLGSNNWVISPKKSRDGMALLANDPHLPLGLPSIWIEMHLVLPDLNVAGFSIPGTPGIIIGRNENIAWGVTNGMIDDSDYFIEDADTVHNFYMKDGKKRQLRVINQRIQIKGQPDYLFTVYETDNGPIFNKVISNSKLPEFLSFKWSGFEISDELRTFRELMKAKGWGDFRSALRAYTVPCQNFVYADRNGNIGYRLGGKVPVRNYGKGVIPVSGSSSKNNWTGEVPFDQMPQSENPARGWIATANNKITNNFPFYLSEYWEPPYRIRRIEQMINERKTISSEDVRLMQTDVKNLMAEHLLSLFFEDFKITEIKNDRQDKMYFLLKNWNFEMEPDKITPSVYECLQYFLIQNIFADEMGEALFQQFVSMPNFYLRIFDQIIGNNKSSWFDDVRTPEKENRPAIFRKSFYEAISYLDTNFGRDAGNWYWGNLHKLELKHILGEHSLTRRVFNRGPFSVGGDGTTVNVGTYQYESPFAVAVGPSLRFIVDWGSANLYESVIPGGNSGHFLSKYYDNQIEKWLNGDLKEVDISNYVEIESIILKPLRNID